MGITLLLLSLTFSLPLAAERHLSICKTYDGRECNVADTASNQAAQNIAASSALHAIPAIIGAFQEASKKIEAYKASCAVSHERGQTQQEYEAFQKSLKKESERKLEEFVGTLLRQSKSDSKAYEFDRKSAADSFRACEDGIAREKEFLSKLGAQIESSRKTAEKSTLDLRTQIAGGLSYEELSRLRESAHQSILNPQDIDASLMTLKLVLGKFRNARTDVAKNQLKELVAELFDEQDLVKPWVDFSPSLKAYSFSTSSDSPIGKELRELANKALGLARLNSDDHEVKEKLEYLIETIISADAYFGPSSGGEQVHRNRLGQRLLQRCRDLYFYTNPHSDLSHKAALRMPSKAAELFGLEQVDLSTFAGYEIYKVAREASRISNIESDELALFHLRTSLQQAQSDANTGDWKGAVRNVDQAWTVVDYAKGFIRGVGEFVEDTVVGLADLVLHPIDSVQSIARAVINYDKTYDAVVDAMQKVWNEYPNYSAEEKGKFWGRATGEILSAVYGGSLVKLAKDTKVVAGVAEAARFIELASEAGPGRLKYLGETSWVTNVYGPLRKGPLHEIPTPSGGSVADTFRSSTYVEKIAEEPVKLYRVWSGDMDELSSYWSRTKPQGPLQAQLDSALDPSWGNKATHWTEIDLPIDQKFYEGVVSEVYLHSHGMRVGKLLGGGSQVYINRKIPRNWIVRTGEFP